VENGWTGGQYSLFRIVFGLYLAVRLVRLALSGSETFSSREAPAALLAAAAVASVLLAVGWRDRPAAAFLLCAGAWLWARDPRFADAGLPCVGFLLLAQAALPPAPYGSLSARGRGDPGGGWRLRPAVFALAWILMAGGHSAHALSGLPQRSGGAVLAQVVEHPAWPLELLAAPLALVPSVRPWLWLALVLLNLQRVVLFGPAEPALGLLMLHFFTFDPGWVKGRGGAVETLFYDGSCALCHGAVRFLLAEDPEGRAFRFAPLDSAAFRSAAAAETRATLPDSLVVAASDGRLLTRSAGVLHLLQRLGGVWRILAVLGRAVPRPLRDGAYDLVARVRYRVFGRKDEACPLVPPALRARFDV
jgi:predicted DCC family thiol-disulfide oxidoreductase YuxK